MNSPFRCHSHSPPLPRVGLGWHAPSLAMGLLLFSHAARSQNPADSARTGLIGIHLNTSSSKWMAVQRPTRSHAPPTHPHHNLALGKNEKRADLEVRLYLMEARLVPTEALARGMRTAAQIL